MYEQLKIIKIIVPVKTAIFCSKKKATSQVNQALIIRSEHVLSQCCCEQWV